MYFCTQHQYTDANIKKINKKNNAGNYLQRIRTFEDDGGRSGDNASPKDKRDHDSQCLFKIKERGCRRMEMRKEVL